MRRSPLHSTVTPSKLFFELTKMAANTSELVQGAPPLPWKFTSDRHLCPFKEEPSELLSDRAVPVVS